MTPAVTVHDNTVQAENILLKLDELAKGYDEVLSMAKTQLENYEITEQDWSRMTIKVARAIDLYDVSVNLGRLLARGMEELDENPDTSSQNADFSRYVTRHILDRLERRVKNYLISEAINEQFSQKFSELRTEVLDLIDHRIQQTVQLSAMQHANKAASDRRILRDLLMTCLGDDLRVLTTKAAQQLTAADS